MEAAATAPDVRQSLALLAALRSDRPLGTLPASLEVQEVIYALACKFYEGGKYPQAMRSFSFLMTANVADARYFMGFAACLHMQRKYAEALKFYGAASLFDLTDPYPAMHSAECHLALGDNAQARSAIDYALCQARAHQDEQLRECIPRLEAMLSFLENA